MTVAARAVDPTDPSSLLARMELEISAGCSGATAVWERCAAQEMLHAQRPRVIVLTGCGDSLYACVGARQAVEDLTGLPAVVWPAMEVTTSPSRLLSEDALLVAVSVSGKVGRTIEAVQAHAARGGRTLAVTSSATSRLAAAAQNAMVTGVLGTPGPVPGTSTYLASLLGLLAVAAGLAPPERSAPFGRSVIGVLDLLPPLLAEAGPFARDVVDDLREPFFAVGTGVDAGTVHFGTAKLLEAAGLVGVAQDLEEWAHEQYFATDPSRTILLCVSDPRALARAVEVAAMAAAVGGRVAWIGLDSPGPLTLRISAVDPLLAPLLGWLPFALIALEYARRHGRFPFGTDRTNRMAVADRSIYVTTTGAGPA